jgi:hypothetical protein
MQTLNLLKTCIKFPLQLAVVFVKLHKEFMLCKKKLLFGTEDTKQPGKISPGILLRLHVICHVITLMFFFGGKKSH